MRRSFSNIDADRGPRENSQTKNFFQAQLKARHISDGLEGYEKVDRKSIQSQAYFRFAADFFVLFLADFFELADFFVLFFAAGFFFVGIMYHPLSMIDKPFKFVIGDMAANSSDIYKFL